MADNAASSDGPARSAGAGRGASGHLQALRRGAGQRRRGPRRSQAGTVHGIVGENGAGKSTLMSVLYGLHVADRGHIEVFGRPVQIRNPQQAIALGIGMVHQHFMLVDSLSALENVLLGAEPHALLRRAAAAMRHRLHALMQSTGLQVELDAPVAELPVGDRQRLEILKALVRGARILILDEPTAVLTPQQAQSLFLVLGRLAAQGTTVLLITHKLKEVMQWCARVTVMRAGRVVHETDVDRTLGGGVGHGDDRPQGGHRPPVAVPVCAGRAAARRGRAALPRRARRDAAARRGPAAARRRDRRPGRRVGQRPEPTAGAAQRYAPPRRRHAARRRRRLRRGALARPAHRAHAGPGACARGPALARPGAWALPPGNRRCWATRARPRPAATAGCATPRCARPPRG